MKSLIAILVAWFCGLTSGVSAEDDGLDAFLDGFVEAHSRSEIDFFYASPPEPGQFSPYVYVYWMSGNAILIVDVPTKRLEDYSWFEFKARVDLADEIVPTKEDVGSSTYLTDAGWAEEKIKACLASGRKFVKKRKTAEPGATDNPDDAQRLREDH